MSQLYMPIWKTLNWHAHGAARKCRGSPTIWFDPEMTWKAKATDKRDRQCSYGDPDLHAHGCNPSKKVIRAGVSSRWPPDPRARCHGQLRECATHALLPEGSSG